MPPKPTDAELAILTLLWEHGPSTVRDVHERLGYKGVGYTTTLEQLQVMLEKGLVRRDDSSRSHVYQAAVSQERTQAVSAALRTGPQAGRGAGRTRACRDARTVRFPSVRTRHR